MNIKDKLSKIPYLCDAKNADRWARVIELVYDDELTYAHGPFAKNELDEADPDNRFEVAFAFEGDEKKKAYCKKLVRLIFLNHYKKEHGETQWDDAIAETALSAIESEKDFPEITAALSVDSIASVAGGWNI